MNRYNTATRDKNAELVIDMIRETTSFEGLYDLFDKIPNELAYLGHRVHECGKEFGDKLMKLARTETQVLIAILTLRDGWDLSYDGRGNKSLLKTSSEGVYWYITPYLKKHFEIEIVEKSTNPKYRQGEEAQRDYQSKREKHLLDVKKVSDRYSKSISTKDKDVQKSITALARKLKTYKVCKMMFNSSLNSDASFVLLRKMVYCVDESNLKEVLYCIDAIARREDFSIDNTQWCKLLAAMMKLK